MNRKIIAPIGAGLIILLLIWLGMGLLKTSPTENQPAPTPGQTASGPSSVSPALPNQQVPAPISEGRPRPASESQGGKFSTLPSLSAAKIVFYGKVVDQDGKPLPDVEVTGKTGSKVAFYTEERRDYQTKTDAEGLFVFDQFKGDGLVIDLNKPGYKFASDHRNFLYSAITGDQKRHEPDAKKPVVFTMFASTGAEPLVHYYGKFFYGKINGAALLIDLTKARDVNQGGDLEIKVVKDPLDKNKWSAALRVVDGGLIEEKKDFQITAPASGYEKEVIVEATQQQPTISKTYYVMSQNKKHYSRVVMSINLGAEDQFNVVLRVWLNPSGSRNLEYDPTKQIKP